MRLVPGRSPATVPPRDPSTGPRCVLAARDRPVARQRRAGRPSGCRPRRRPSRAGSTGHRRAASCRGACRHAARCREGHRRRSRPGGSGFVDQRLHGRQLPGAERHPYLVAAAGPAPRAAGVRGAGRAADGQRIVDVVDEAACTPTRRTIASATAPSLSPNSSCPGTCSMRIARRPGSCARTVGTRSGSTAATRRTTLPSSARNGGVALNHTSPWSVGAVTTTERFHVLRWRSTPVRRRPCARNAASTQSGRWSSPPGSAHHSRFVASPARAAATGPGGGTVGVGGPERT